MGLTRRGLFAIMGKGITTTTALRLPMNPGRDPGGAFKNINLWGNGLPFGAVGFRVVRSSDDAAIATTDYGITEYDTVLEDYEAWWPIGATTASAFYVPRGCSGEYVITSTHLVPPGTTDCYSFIQTNNIPSEPTNALPVGQSGNAGTMLVATAIVRLEAGAEITAGIYNGSGGSVTPTYAAHAISLNAWFPMLTCYRISLL